MTSPLIDTPAALAGFCESLQGVPWIALDSEFVRERTYHARLCLLQVASETGLACIDTLALPELGLLAEQLFQPGVVKVMHAAQQDLEIFQRLWERLPEPLFDTQIAAALLGQGEQIGYAALVKALLGVELDKSQTRTDWSRRPLSAAQLEYAAADVRYLGPLYRRQHQALAQSQRLEWLWAETAPLTAAGNAPTAEPWRRVKGHRNLHGVQLAVLQALAGWREQQAEARDLPRQWVINDDTLSTLARRLPRNPEQLQRLGLDQRLLRRDGAALLALIRQARELPAEQWPVLPAWPALNDQQQALLERAQTLIRDCAQRYGLAAPLLATRRELETWLHGAEIPASGGWRATLVGEALQQLREQALKAEAATADSPDNDR